MKANFPIMNFIWNTEFSLSLWYPCSRHRNRFWATEDFLIDYFSLNVYLNVRSYAILIFTAGKRKLQFLSLWNKCKSLREESRMFAKIPASFEGILFEHALLFTRTTERRYGHCFEKRLLFDCGNIIEHGNLLHKISVKCLIYTTAWT